MRPITRTKAGSHPFGHQLSLWEERQWGHRTGTQYLLWWMDSDHKASEVRVTPRKSGVGKKALSVWYANMNLRKSLPQYFERPLSSFILYEYRPSQPSSRESGSQFMVPDSSAGSRKSKAVTLMARVNEHRARTSGDLRSVRLLAAAASTCMMRVSFWSSEGRN